MILYFWYASYLSIVQTVTIFSEVTSVKMVIILAHSLEYFCEKLVIWSSSNAAVKISPVTIYRLNYEIIKKLIPASARSKNHLHPKQTADLYCKAVLLGTVLSVEIYFRPCSTRAQSFSDFILQHKSLLNSKKLPVRVLLPLFHVETVTLFLTALPIVPLHYSQYKEKCD